MSIKIPFVALTLLASACADLEAVEPGTCGNLVVEAGEQCDGADTCGTEASAACRFTCEPGVSACPDALACAADGVCVATAGTFVPYGLARRYELAADRLVVGDLDGDRRDDLVAVAESIRVRFGDVDAPLFASYEKRIRPPTGSAAFGELDDQPGLDVVFPTVDGVFTLLARGRELDAVPYASASSLPDDGGAACAPSPGWAACRLADVNDDDLIDRVGFVTDRDNLEIELARPVGGPVLFVLDTLDLITDVTTGDFDGDGFDDVAFSTRSVDVGDVAGVQVVYGAPQPELFAMVEVAAGVDVTGVAAADLDDPADGLSELAVEVVSDELRVAVYRGDSSRDLSAPFRLEGDRAQLDVPYALVAGEFVGGAGSGVDVMAYARNADAPGRTFFWWLRGLGGAQLTVGAVDQVDATSLQFLDEQWRVADLVVDPSTGNGPDEVIGLSPRAPGCDGPALTAAVPSARFTATELLRSACLEVDGDGWQPALIGVLDGAATLRSVAIARQGEDWWLGETEHLEDATDANRLAGTTTSLEAGCRDPQLWAQTPDAGMSVSWICDGPSEASLVVLSAPRGEVASTSSLATLPAGATHVTGDFNGDGLTDVVVRNDREIAVLLQCSTDMVGATPGC